MALESLHVCAALSKPLVLTSAISTKVSCAQPFKLDVRIQQVKKIT